MSTAVAEPHNFLPLSCNLICLERESATSASDNYHHQSREHALRFKVRRSSSSRKWWTWMMDDLQHHDLQTLGKPCLQSPVWRIRTLCVCVWICMWYIWLCSTSTVCFRMCVCTCVCVSFKNEWPACANERWREAVIETLGRMGDGNGRVRGVFVNVY